jgi:hypothetical protein
MQFERERASHPPAPFHLQNILHLSANGLGLGFFVDCSMLKIDDGLLDMFAFQATRTRKFALCIH